MHKQDYDTTQAMIDEGGAFVRALALAWQHGDSVNKRLIKITWPEYWAKYEKIAKDGER